MLKTSECAACLAFGSVPVELAVDPACVSPREADRLCRTHRARMTEGYCVVCARREPRYSPFPASAIGCCVPCAEQAWGPLPGGVAPALALMPGSR